MRLTGRAGGPPARPTSRDGPPARPARRSGSRRGQRGSVLMLVPVGFLVLILLGAIAADSAVAYLGQRQLTDELEAAVNDAATAGLDSAAYYRSGRVTLDLPAAEAAACASIAAQGDGHLHDLRVSIGVAGATVELLGRATVDAIFGRAVPGFATRAVSGLAVATAEEAPSTAPPAPSTLVPLPCG